MKNKKSLFAALALSATLVLGTAIPAFAAGVSNEMDTGEDSVSTSVFLSTEADSVSPSEQIVVSVPLSMNIVAQEKGGAIIAPSVDAYKIINGSSVAIDVKPSYSVETNDFLNLNIVSEQNKVKTDVKKDGNLWMTMALYGVDNTLWTLGGAAQTWTLESGSTNPIEINGETSELSKVVNNSDAAVKVLTVTYTAAKHVD